MARSIQTPAALHTPVSDHVMVALRKIIQAIELNSRKLVKRVGMTGPQLLVLQEIARMGETTAGSLARKVSLTQATVTGVLDRIESQELILRRRSQQDRRRVKIRITEKGKRVLKNAPPLMQEAFVEQFSNLQDWEQSMILSALQRLVSIMDARAIQAAPFLETRPLGAQNLKSDSNKPLSP